MAGKLLRQIEDEAGNREDIVLIALKTDGGGFLGARSYFRNHRARLDRWLLGADDQGGLQKSILGKEDLWSYLVVDGKGNIAAKGSCSAYYTIEGKQVPAILQDRVVTKHAPTGGPRFLPAKKKYDPALDLCLTALRCRDYRFALERCQLLIKQKTHADKARDLVKDILAGLGRIAKAATADLTGKDVPKRFHAYLQLRMIKDVARREEVGKAAAKAMKAVRSDKQLKRELAAEKAYEKVLDRVRKSRHGVPPSTRAKWLLKVAERHPDTVFGRRAKKEAKPRQ